MKNLSHLTLFLLFAISILASGCSAEDALEKIGKGSSLEKTEWTTLQEKTLTADKSNLELTKGYSLSFLDEKRLSFMTKTTLGCTGYEDVELLNYEYDEKTKKGVISHPNGTRSYFILESGDKRLIINESITKSTKNEQIIFIRTK